MTLHQARQALHPSWELATLGWFRAVRGGSGAPCGVPLGIISRCAGHGPKVWLNGNPCAGRDPEQFDTRLGGARQRRVRKVLRVGTLTALRPDVEGKRQRMPRLFLEGAVYAGLWAVLGGGSPASWLVGAPAVGLALLLSRHLAPDGCWVFRWLALGRFVPWFFAQSLRAGIDVAGRAFRRHPGLAPAVLDYRLRLPPGPARCFFMLVISLIPGTLTAAARDDLLLVHVLDRAQDNRRDLCDLETRVAEIFGLPLKELSDGA